MFEIGTTLSATSYFAALLIARSILLWAFGLLEQQVLRLLIEGGLYSETAMRSAPSCVVPSRRDFAFPTLLFAVSQYGTGESPGADLRSLNFTVNAR